MLRFNMNGCQILVPIAKILAAAFLNDVRWLHPQQNGMLGIMFEYSEHGDVFGYVSNIDNQQILADTYLLSIEINYFNFKSFKKNYFNFKKMFYRIFIKYFTDTQRYL